VIESNLGEVFWWRGRFRLRLWISSDLPRLAHGQDLIGLNAAKRLSRPKGPENFNIGRRGSAQAEVQPGIVSGKVARLRDKFLRLALTRIGADYAGAGCDSIRFPPA
jgi:hypothetical protein